MQRLRAAVRDSRGQAERQPALAEVEAADLREQLRLALLAQLEPPLLDDVEADDAEIADVLLHEARNVVVAHEQHVDGHVLAVADQLILAARVAQAAAHESSSECSVRRPDFCTAILILESVVMRMSETSALERRQALQRRLVAAVAGDQEPRDAPDRRHGHAGQLVNLAIGQAVLADT